MWAELAFGGVAAILCHSFYHTTQTPLIRAIFAITSDAMVNSLVISSPYSVLYAAYSMRHEASSSEIYGKLPVDEMLQSALGWPWHKGTHFIDKNLPHFAPATSHSLAAKTTEYRDCAARKYGGLLLSSPWAERASPPELEKLKQQGVWFNNMYATGTPIGTGD